MPGIIPAIIGSPGKPMPPNATALAPLACKASFCTYLEMLDNRKISLDYQVTLQTCSQENSISSKHELKHTWIAIWCWAWASTFAWSGFGCPLKHNKIQKWDAVLAMPRCQDQHLLSSQESEMRTEQNKETSRTYFSSRSIPPSMWLKVPLVKIMSISTKHRRALRLSNKLVNDVSFVKDNYCEHRD